ncbi:MAG: 2TM domain-containing protein [Nitrososphaerota archaeon]
MGEELTLEEFKEALKELRVSRARRDFLSHLISYIIVNAFLIFINLWTSPGAIWFPWVLAAWGIGLAFHYFGSRPSSVIEEAEKEIAMIEYRARRRKKSAEQ